MGDRKINDEVMERVELLAQLKLIPEEREEVRAEIEKILDYVEKLNELDTTNIEPLVHISSEVNVFREDCVTNDDGQWGTLVNAPKERGGQFEVPKTI